MVDFAYRQESQTREKLGNGGLRGQEIDSMG
jgi:hypothetical protein